MTQPGMAGPGGPHERSGVVWNLGGAVWLDELNVATIDDALATPDGVPVALAGVEVNGRTIGKNGKAYPGGHVVLVLTPDAAAAVIHELVMLGSRDLDMRRAAEEPADQLAAGFGAQLRVALDMRREAYEREVQL